MHGIAVVSLITSKYRLFFYSILEFFSMMALNSFMQQIPVLTSANILAMAVGTHQPPSFDPLTEIRNGEKRFFLKRKKISFVFLARLKVASVWRRFLAETVDFILLHAFK